MFKDLCNTLLSSGVDALALLLWGHQTAPIYKKKLTTDFILEIEHEAGILETVLPVDESCITIVKQTVLIDVDIRFSPEIFIFLPDKIENLELHLDQEQEGNLWRFLNHSDDPNVKVFSYFDELNGIEVVKVYVIKNVKSGDELCFDYGEKYWNQSDV
ncbi:hypothetical protein CYMTET_40049 [Cymbomonas tetramitiformis]|uniref:SET domain-containing protein n=1 Tax=Cymbomonas tetramitiformis TaxID=36881 RepID=A0AAE0C8U2_9CHLO|nr:hypothetical protein CYMTET_40049 [Cymbomonas tetramitiformis]